MTMECADDAPGNFAVQKIVTQVIEYVKGYATRCPKITKPVFQASSSTGL